MNPSDKSISSLFSDVLEAAVKYFSFHELYGIYVHESIEDREKLTELLSLLGCLPIDEIFDLLRLEKDIHTEIDIADMLNVWMHNAPEILPELILNKVVSHTKKSWGIDKFSCVELNDKQNIINELQSMQDKIAKIISNIK